MRAVLRAVLTLAVMSVALLVGVAAPAAGAPPQKISGTAMSLDSFTTECVDQADGTACTDIYLSVWSFPEEEAGACLTITTSVFPDSGQEPTVTSETGCADDVAAFTVTDTLTATLQPTRITFCDDPGGECSPTDRSVTVSASDTASGPVSTVRSQFKVNQDGCTLRYKSTGINGPVDGTITIDGVTYDETGFASREDLRLMSKNCPLP